MDVTIGTLAGSSKPSRSKQSEHRQAYAKFMQQLDSSRSLQVPPPRQCYSPGGITIFGFAVVPLMPPLTQW